MPSRYASGKYAIAQCDRCDESFMLKDLKKEVIKTRLFNLKVCPECWDPDQPQLQLGMYPVDDPQAVREPRPDVSYTQAGTNGLQILLTNSTTVNGFGYPTQGSRNIQWGWNPVGGASSFDSVLTPNYLVLYAEVGTVTISTI
jgi:hypothetical protein